MDKAKEYPDRTPRAVPSTLRIPSRLDEIRALVRQEMSRQAELQGFETFEESDDFDVGDDFDPRSPYEEIFEPRYAPPPPPEVAAHEDKAAAPADSPPLSDGSVSDSK